MSSGMCFNRVVDAAGLTYKVRIKSTHNDARMARLLTVQADEVSAVKSQQCPSISTGKSQYGLVR